MTVITSLIAILDGTTDFYTSEEKDYWFKNIKSKKISNAPQMKGGIARVSSKPDTRFKKKPKNLVIFEIKKIILATLETVYIIGKEMNLRRIYNTLYVKFKSGSTISEKVKKTKSGIINQGSKE